MVMEPAAGLFRVLKAVIATVLDPWRMRPFTVINVIRMMAAFDALMWTFDDGAGADRGNNKGGGKQRQGY